MFLPQVLSEFQRSMRKRSTRLGLTLLAIASAWLGTESPGRLSFFSKNGPSASEQKGRTFTIPMKQDTLSSPRTYRVIGVGDIMLGTNYPSPSYLPPHDGAALLAEVKDTLRQADVTFGNLEGTMFDHGGLPKRCQNPSVCYVFRTPSHYVRYLVEAGFDLLSLANNHSGDFGPEGRRQTMQTLREAKIAFAGLEGICETAVIERAGKRWGLCAFAPNTGTCDLRDIPRAQALVRQLKGQVDFLIVSFHGGAEGPAHQRVPRRTEYFHGENRGDVYTFAHAVVDAGADVVLGHGPHVPRAIELYKDRLIAYSLGNFCTYGRFSLAGPAGIAPILQVDIDEQGRFAAGQIIPTYQQKHCGPKFDPQRRAIETICQLTSVDFPETLLTISPEGHIHRSEEGARLLRCK